MVDLNNSRSMSRSMSSSSGLGEKEDHKQKQKRSHYHHQANLRSAEGRGINNSSSSRSSSNSSSNRSSNNSSSSNNHSVTDQSSIKSKTGVNNSSDDDDDVINLDRKFSLYGLHHSNKKYFLNTWNSLSNNQKSLLAEVYVKITSFNISMVNVHTNDQCWTPNDYAYTCYTTELEKYVLGGTSEPLLQYMYKLSHSYFQVWASRKAFLNQLYPISIKSSYRPKKDNSCAMVTITHNEEDMFPIWFRYYSRHFEPRDMFVLDHMTTDGSLDNLPKDVWLIKYNVKYAMPVHDRSETIRFFQDFLFRMAYKCVVYSDVDEIIVPNPMLYPGGLAQYLTEFIGQGDKELYVRVKAYELVNKYSEIYVYLFMHIYILHNCTCAFPTILKNI